MLNSICSKILRALLSKAGIAIESAGIAVAVTVWISGETHKAEVANLTTTHELELNAQKERTASIHRRLGNSDHFDLRKLLVQKSDFQSVPAGSAYVSTGGFYAKTNSADWEYSVCSCKELSKLLTGDENLESTRLFESAPVHCWRKREVVGICGSSVVSNLVAAVAVVKLPMATVRDELGVDDTVQFSLSNPSTNALTLNVNGDRVTLAGATVSNNAKVVPYMVATSKRTLNLRDAFPGDVVGVLLADALEKLFLSTSYLSKEMSGELVELQKLDNVLYGQFRFTLKDITIRGVKHSEYYYYLDTMAVGIKSDVYIIAACLPSGEPTARGPDFQWVTDWYENFAIVY